jgi:ABC-type multidrug transport system ATPase subunit
MSEIQRETGTTFLLSTHDRELADRCDRRIYIRGGVVASQTREVLDFASGEKSDVRVIDKTFGVGIPDLRHAAAATLGLRG